MKKTYLVRCFCGEEIHTRFAWRARRFANRHGVSCSANSRLRWLEDARRWRDDTVVDVRDVPADWKVKR